MSEDTIRVTALDTELTFEGREELAEHVEEIIEHRGGLFDPLELAAIRKLAHLANGDAPPAVHRIARQTSFHTPAREREETPFADRIEEAREVLEARDAELEEARERLFSIRAQLRGKRDASAAELGRLREAEEDVKAARRAAMRARATWNASKLAADRWRADHEARWVVGPPEDRRTVDRDGLMEFIENRR